MTSLPTPVTLRWGVPVYRFGQHPGALPVAVLRLGDEHPADGRRHIHDFPLLLLVDSGAATGGAQVWVAATGAVIDPKAARSRQPARSVIFDPAVLGVDAGAASWPGHPLLFPFTHRRPGGILRLEVPPGRIPSWRQGISAIESELAGQPDGFETAVVAQLTLLLVDLARLAAPLLGRRPAGDDRILAAVSAAIEQGFAGPLSLRDVAAQVGLTPGYLATLVRQRTGRTVVEWIVARRMAAARRLLGDSDLPIAEIARRVGFPDPAYFARVFRRHNGVTARQWRDLSPSP